MAYTGTDQGSDRRSDVRVDVECEIEGFLGGSSCSLQVQNLSCHGAMLRREERFPPPVVHLLHLDVGVEQPLRLLAQTVWKDPERYGVRFLGMTPGDRLAIARYLDDKLQGSLAAGLA